MTHRIAGRKLQAIRARHFRKHPLCVVCLSKGRDRLATELDHIVPLFKGGKDIESNRQGLCHDCHAQKTSQDKGHRVRPEIGLDGFEVSAHDAQRTPWSESIASQIEAGVQQREQ